MNNKLKLHDDEKILLELKPSRGSVPYFFLVRCWHVGFIILFFAIFFSSSIKQDNAELTSLVSGLGATAGLIILAVLACLVVLGLLYTKMCINGYDYVITNQRCILKYGFISLNKRIIPYGQINDIDMRSNALERMFGFGSVYIDCTATVLSSNRNRAANNTCRMEGLTMDECEQAMHAMSECLAKR